jgi:hypothetical protein
MKKIVLMFTFIFLSTASLSEAAICGCQPWSISWLFGNVVRYEYAVSGEDCCAPQAGYAIQRYISADPPAGIWDESEEYVSIADAQKECCE